jgi:hypothetical protein
MVNMVLSIYRVEFQCCGGELFSPLVMATYEAGRESDVMAVTGMANAPTVESWRRGRG